MAAQGNPIGDVPEAISIGYVLGLKIAAGGKLQIVKLPLALFTGGASEADVNAVSERVDGVEDDIAAILADTSAIPGALAAKVDKTTAVTGGGMASGGGDLSGNRTITVTPASDAEMKARTANKPADARGVGVAIDDFFKGVTVELMPVGSGFLFAFRDSNSRRLFAVTEEGKVTARISDASVVPRAALATELQASLPPSGVVFKTMPQGSGWKWVVASATTGHIFFGLTEQDRLWGKLADNVVLPQGVLDALLATQNYLPTANIYAFGDSMTEDGVSPAHTNWTTLLAAELGVSVSNQGRGSQITKEIVARQGGTPMKVSVASDSIPASGPVNVTAYDVDIGYYGGNSAWLAIPVTILGIAGSMAGQQDGTGSAGSQAHASGTYKFTRTTPGSAVACPPNTPAIPTTGVAAQAATQLHWCGRNDVGSLASNGTALINLILSMGSYQSPKIRRRLVIGVCTAANEFAAAGGTFATNYAAIVAFNKRLASALGPTFLDLRRELIDEGLALAGLTPTSQDLIDIANDTIPRSLLAADLLHPSGDGSVAIKAIVARRLRALWY